METYKLKIYFKDLIDTIKHIINKSQDSELQFEVVIKNTNRFYNLNLTELQILAKQYPQKNLNIFLFFSDFIINEKNIINCFDENKINDLKNLTNCKIEAKFNVNIRHSDYKGMFNAMVSLHNTVSEVDFTFNVKENGRKGWTEAWKQVKIAYKSFNLFSQPQLSKINCKFNVFIDHGNDVTNLKYYVILFKGLKISNPSQLISIYLNINLNEKSDKIRQSYVFRIVQSFAYLPKSIKDSILIDGEKLLLMSAMASNILLLPVTDKWESKYLVKPLANYLAAIFQKNYYKGDIGHKMNSDTVDRLIKDLARYVLRKCIFDEGSIDNILTNNDNNEKSSIIDKLINTLNSIIEKNNMGFTYLIFVYLIRDYLVHNMLFQYKNNNWEINYKILELTYFNAQSYSEGLWQAIENALIHSSGRSAIFGIRFYNADPDCSASNILSHARSRDFLWRKYWRDNNNKFCIKRRSHAKGEYINASNANNIFNIKDKDTGKVLFPNYLEITILDCAINRQFETIGIIENVTNKLKCEINSISEIFSLTQKAYNNPVNYYIAHYGMRLLLQHINTLNGIIELISPYKDIIKDRIVYNNIFSTDTYNIEELTDIYFTEYSILIPIATHPLYNQYKDSNDKSGTYFQPIKENYCNNEKLLNYNKVHLKRVDIQSTWSFNKLELIDEYYILLKEPFKKFFEEGGLLYLNAKYLLNDLQTELLSKALFKIIFECAKEKNYYIAIDFEDNQDLAKEFIRIFSIFYIKIGDEKSIKNIMSKIQIAVCSNLSGTGYSNLDMDVNFPRKAVNFILTGEDLRSVYRSASKFIYYNGEASISFMPLLDFLSQNNNDDNNGQPKCIFPFDLYLSSTNEKKDGLSKIRSWFEWQMLDKITTGVSSDNYGCMLRDIVVRLGSKIYIDRFYEAELLFHSDGIIKRFAYLVAQKIISLLQNTPLSEKNTLYIVGYENYSANLIMEIELLLTKYFDNENVVKIRRIIECHSEEFPITACNLTSDSDEEKIIFIIVTPISATMTTHYKLKDSISRGLSKSLNSGNINWFHICLIAVGDCFLNKEVDNVESKYITNITTDSDYRWTVANLQPQYYKQNQVCKDKELKVDLNVNYLLPVPAKWKSPENKFYDIDIFKPVLHVDSTSTLLDTDYQKKLTADASAYYFRKNEVDQ